MTMKTCLAVKMFSESNWDEDIDYGEYSQKQLLNFEKEMLGLYISGHPLAEFQELLAGLNTIEKLNEEKDKSIQVIGGVISKMKQIFTKSGQPMYFLTLEDLTDNIEVIVFPTVLEKYKEVLEENKIIKIKGRLDKKEDQVKLIAIDIEDVKNGKLKKVNTAVSEENEKDKIILAVNKVDLSKELINELYEVIKDFSGSTGVELKILNGNGSSAERIFNFPDNYKVTSDNLFFEKLKEVFKNKLSWELKDSIK